MRETLLNKKEKEFFFSLKQQQHKNYFFENIISFIYFFQKRIFAYICFAFQKRKNLLFLF